MLIVQIRAEPVKHGHEIIAYAFHADFAAIYYILRVVFDEFIPRGLAELDIFVYGNTLDHFHFKPRAVCKRF